MDKALSDLFRQLREDHGLTQPQVATAGRVAQGLISRIETDASYQPSVGVFLRAVRGLGISLTEFFARYEKRSPAPVLTVEPRPQRAQTLTPASSPRRDRLAPPALPDEEFARRIAEAILDVAGRRARDRENDHPSKPRRTGHERKSR